jgi:hypothetical protein
MRAIGLLTVSLLVSDVGATAPHYVYPYNWMEAGEVVRKLTIEPRTEQEYLQRDLAHHYVNGIKDGTQGTLWCFKGTILPHELNLQLAHAFEKARQAPNSKETRPQCLSKS